MRVLYAVCSVEIQCSPCISNKIYNLEEKKKIRIHSIRRIWLYYTASKLSKKDAELE